MGSVGAAAVAVISGGGYLGIVLLMALESACLPLPSEVVMPFAGYLVSTGRFNLWLVATAGALGCNLGSAAAYFLGSRGGRPFVEKYGRYVLLDRVEIDRVDRFFARFGNSAVFVGRLLPGVRTFIALPAGVARMPLVPFHLLTFLGSWPWCLGLAYVGMKLGEQWNTDPRFHQVVGDAKLVILALLAAGLAAYVWLRLRHRAAA